MLDVLLDRLRVWQRSINLIAPSTMGSAEERHVRDSLKVAKAVPDGSHVADLGSGGGFPGLVIAAQGSTRGVRVELIESTGKKCAFLRDAARAMGLENVTVHHGRIETIAPLIGPVDLICARALADLDTLFELSTPLRDASTIHLFPKGAQVEAELTATERCWRWDELTRLPAHDSQGVILRFRGVERVRA